MLPGFFHDTLGERDRSRRLDLIRPFPRKAVRGAVEALDLTDADRAGYTRDEADRLASPLPLLSPKGLYWAIEPRLHPHRRLALHGHEDGRSPPASIPARRSTMSTRTRRAAPAARPA